MVWNVLLQGSTYREVPHRQELLDINILFCKLNSLDPFELVLTLWCCKKKNHFLGRESRLLMSNCNLNLPCAVDSRWRTVVSLSMMTPCLSPRSSSGSTSAIPVGTTGVEPGLERTTWPPSPYPMMKMVTVPLMYTRCTLQWLIM